MMSAFERDMRCGMKALSPQPTEEQIREFLDSVEPSDRFLQVSHKANLWMVKHGLSPKPPAGQPTKQDGSSPAASVSNPTKR